MEKAHPWSTPMVVQSLNVKKKTIFILKKMMKKFLVHVPYLSVIDALMYLTNCRRLDIAFSINLLAKYNFAPTRRHWNGVKHVLRYLYRTTYMRLFYSRDPNSQLVR
jgi:hypothetical protein